ncbi:hypothetical protein NUSPORA_02987 [Nucleospora cyclopteri]
MLVKDLLKMSVDENMVNLEKCGSSNYFWRFKYQEHHKIQCEIEKATEAIAAYDLTIAELKEKIQEMTANREETAEREILVQKYNALKKKAEQLQEIEEKFMNYSLKKYEEISKETEIFTKEINEITDNIFTVQSFVINKFGIDKQTFNEQFGVPEEMDYI